MPELRPVRLDSWSEKAKHSASARTRCSAMLIPLVRTNKGTMIHASDCIQLRRCKLYPPVPWNWADDKDIRVIALVIAKYGYNVCRRCQPVPNHIIVRYSA